MLKLAINNAGLNSFSVSVNYETVSSPR